MKKVLLFGPHGQLGTELLNGLPQAGFEVIPGDRSRVDLAKSDEIRQFIQAIRPEIVVNAAAYTAVDKAENEPVLAHAVNATAPSVMAQECARLGAYMVHYSTDYVFDGTKSEPYTEDDETRPLNVYGESKLNGEREVLQSGAHCVIFRVPWLYSCRGRNFVLTMLRLACANDSLTVVDDQIGTPTPATLIADLTAKVIISRRLAGLFHLAPEGSVSRYNLARAVIQAASIPAVTVRPVSSSQFPSAVRRPAYSVLSVKKFSAASGISLLPWQEYLKRSVSEFCAAGVVQ